mgnify:CR=1 FL=1
MKSKRAEQVLDVASFTDEFDYRYVHFENACEAVDLAEKDAEEEVTRYRKELEESKKREDLARKVIDDQRKEMEKLKARAVEAFLMACSCGRDICSYRAEGVGCTDYLRGCGCSQYSVFIQKLNEK